jgi:hypothetical protein
MQHIYIYIYSYLQLHPDLYFWNMPWHSEIAFKLLSNSSQRNRCRESQEKDHKADGSYGWDLSELRLFQTPSGKPGWSGLEELMPCLVRKKFQDFSSHRIFGRIHRALNIDENKN